MLVPMCVYFELVAPVIDGNSQMTEETRNAAMSGSIGIVMAIGVSAILGWYLLLGLLFSIQDLDATVNSATGQPVAQIFLDTVGTDGAIVLMVCFQHSTHNLGLLFTRSLLSDVCSSAGKYSYSYMRHSR